MLRVGRENGGCHEYHGNGRSPDRGHPTRRRPGADDAGDRQGVPARRVAASARPAGAAGGRPDAEPRRGGRVGRGERLGQVHPHEGDRRSPHCGRGHRHPTREARVLPAGSGAVRAADLRRTLRVVRARLRHEPLGDAGGPRRHLHRTGVRALRPHPRGSALRRNRGQAEPGPGAAGRPGPATARRALRRFRLGHLPEVLGTGRGTPRRRPHRADHQPLRRRRAALRPDRRDPGREGGAAMNAFPFVRRFLADYVRNPVNLFLLVVVPTVFVVVAAGRLADLARLLGSATAGWAAGFLAGIAMYFQVSAARDADRALVVAGLPARRLVAARLAAGFGLAALAGATALVALAVRTGIDNPARTIAGTAMFALIYLGIGATIGALVRNPVNGSVLVLLVWIVDVMLGPSMGLGSKLVTRFLP